MLRTILRTSLIVLLIAALLIGGLFIFSKTNTTSAVTYQPYTASQGTISNALSFSGSLQLIDNVTYTADAASEVRTVYVAVGDQVTAGQKLIRLSNGQTVEAEFDGRVNQLLVSAGDQVAAGDQLIQIADFGRMTVSIRVDEYDISEVHVGQTARVTVTATEQTIETVIDSINYISASTGNVAYYTATAYVDVPEGVYPGMQATISIPQSEAQNVGGLKLEAISFDETNQAYVLMQAEDGSEIGHHRQAHRDHHGDQITVEQRHCQLVAAPGDHRHDEGAQNGLGEVFGALEAQRDGLFQSMEAVEEGLINEIGGLSDALAYIDKLLL